MRAPARLIEPRSRGVSIAMRGDAAIACASLIGRAGCCAGAVTPGIDAASAPAACVPGRGGTALGEAVAAGSATRLGNNAFIANGHPIASSSAITTAVIMFFWSFTGDNGLILSGSRCGEDEPHGTGS